MNLKNARRNESVYVLAVKEVAARLRVSYHVVLALIARGELPARRVGPKMWRVSPADLEAYMALRKVRNLAICEKMQS